MNQIRVLPGTIIVKKLARFHVHRPDTNPRNLFNYLLLLFLISLIC
jgi:hypothetical protein